MKKVLRKLRKKVGFTMIELLVACIIMLLVSLMISTGVSVGLRVQRQSLFVSNSGMLAGSLNTAISDVLRYATSDGNTINYGGLGTNDKLLFTNKEYGIFGPEQESRHAGGFFFVDDSKHLAVSMNGCDPHLTLTENQLDETNVDYVGEYNIPNIQYLVSNGAYGSLIIKNFEITFDPVTGIFSGSYQVAESESDTCLKKDVTFTYHTLAE